MAPALGGYSHVFEGRYKEALEGLEQTVELFSEAGGTWREIRARLEQGETQTVAGDYEKALQTFSTMKSASEPLYHPDFNPAMIMSEYAAGVTQVRMGDLSGVKARADRIASLVKDEHYDSFFLDFHHLLSAEINLSQNDYGAAEGALEEVSHNTSKYSPHFRALQARLQFASGDHSAAARTYGNMCNEVMRSNLSYGGDMALFFLNCSRVNYNLGNTYEAMGNAPKAIEYYEKALDQWKNADEDLPELIDTKARLEKLRTSN
jgi:tetratricopeptide (TPR) repeat protein